MDPKTNCNNFFSFAIRTYFINYKTISSKSTLRKILSNSAANLFLQKSFFCVYKNSWGVLCVLKLVALEL